LFERFTSDLKGEQQTPFFKTIFTLSSHEPFEFPDKYKFGKDTEENKFMSSHAYTDSVVGDFIKTAKKQPWWDNTVIIIMADHGHPLPKHEGAFNAPIRFQIPMLWLGGALTETNKRNTSFCSQTDFAYTLLDMLNGNNSDFEWGNNFFNDAPNHFAHYIFNNGFGTIDNNGYFVYDYVSKKTIEKKGTSAKKMELLGKVITQKAYQDFIER
jgi:phosphoglycerol transferase MdoB-like AlkP superfamily enzyme